MATARTLMQVLLIVIFFSLWTIAGGRSTSMSFYKWEEMPAVFGNSTTGSDQPPGSGPRTSVDPSFLAGRPFASQLLGGVPVYVSMTTIHNRLYGVAATLETILKGTVLPTHVYIFVSSEPYLLDQGISKEFMLASSHKLRALAEKFPHITVVFTDNIGPHRKLLPLLAKKWEEDCVIVTVDDHEMYPRGVLASLIDYYRASGGTAVVALRSRRMGICANAPPWKVSPYTKKHKGLWPETKPGRREMLMLPTGTGGVLYRPKFFHPIVFDRRFLNLTKTGDDLMFRLATMAKGIAVVTACTEYENNQNTCPSQKNIGAMLASQELPLIPQLKSIKRAEFDDMGGVLGGNHSAVSTSASTTGVIQPALPPPGVGGPAKKASSAAAPHGTGSVDGKVSTSRAVSLENAKEVSSTTTQLKSKEEGEVEEERGLSVDHTFADASTKVALERTLQQKKAKALRAHEYRLAALNEVGSLRQRSRRLSRQDASEADPGYGSAGEGRPYASSTLLHQHHSRLGKSASLDLGSAGGGGGQVDVAPRGGGGGGEEVEESEHHDGESKHKDMRKKESLASKFNALGGNNVMWTHSITFLNHLGVLDFESVLQYYAPKERMPCVLLSSVFSQGAGSKKRDVFSSMLDSMRISLQNLYNHECGILMCQED